MQAAAQFIQCHGDSLRFFGRWLKVKWQHDFFSDKPEYNDAFRWSTVDKTVYVTGFDRPVGLNFIISKITPQTLDQYWSSTCYFW